MTGVEQLREQLDELRARVEGLVTRVDDQEDRLSRRAADPSPSTADGSPQDWTCSSLAKWVEEVFAWHFTRDHETQAWYWCPMWWDHVEAVSRLTALWHAWEDMHKTAPAGAGLAGWYHELDHQLPILMGPHGPFRLCRTGVRHQPDDAPLPSERPPLVGDQVSAQLSLSRNPHTRR